jgi:lipopolysaccharide/colanic/teichoic acid biosynthesis glycosyltransferase
LGIQLVAIRKQYYSRAFPWREAVWSFVAAAERIFALILLLALLPGLALAALAVVVLSRRCPLIAHARVGRGGRQIWVLKLRTMWGDGIPIHRRRALFIERLEGAPPPEIKRSDDPRVTSLFAAACRKFSIDELPQLWHVVRGELSLVGPRPMTFEELAEHYGHAGAEVLQLKPGLTGLWQVRGRSSLNYRQRRRLDLFLVRRWSLRLYLAILLATVPRVLLGKDAW